MTILAVLARQRPVCSRSQQPAEEVVLAAFGGQAVVVEAQHLLRDQAVKDRGHTLDRAIRQRRDPSRRERLPEHGGVLQHRALVRREAVEPRRGQRVQRLGHIQLADVAGHPIAASVLFQQPTVEQHPHGLYGVQRHTFGARQNSRRQLLGQPGHEPVEQLAHRGVG